MIVQPCTKLLSYCYYSSVSTTCLIRLAVAVTSSVKTLAGAIDILTATEVVEVKKIGSWKHAIGQVLVYGDYYPSHQKRIHLYGETQESFLTTIKKHCEKRGILVTWEA